MNPRRILACIMLSAVAGAFPAGPAAATGWMNVCDLGASGSDFQTTARTTAGSNVIEVADAGDFRVGQGVMVSRCNIQVTGLLYGPGSPYRTRRPLEGAVELRGYDGAAGSWLVYILEVDGADPLTFRWSDDLARTWAARKVPVTYDWQELSNGIECRFARQEWEPGHMIVFILRDQLISTIEAIEGDTLTLADEANRSADDAVVLHNDTKALQAAINNAVAEKRNLYFPNGRYRLSGRLSVRNAASIVIQGQSSTDTILDISNGTGACLSLYGGKDVTVRNFRMVGHTGMAQAAGSFRTSSNQSFWACALKSCQAVTIHGTERTLIDNVHAYHMAAEAFYSQGACRSGDKEPAQYQKSLTYYRCSVTDCAANAFNNNDTGENTSVLFCRVDGAGWHAAEMPAKFFRFIGNYVRNAGPVTVGDMNHRPEDLYRLGCGQAIIADNVFEGIGRCGGVNINHGSGQVVVNSNLFINFNGPAIRASSYTTTHSFPSRNIAITNNIIDLTCVRDDAHWRTGITVSASNTIVSGNQIFVRGAGDEHTAGISISEPAVNVSVHDNQVSNCTIGISSGRCKGTVREVIDERTFLTDRIPLEWKTSHLYRGWGVAWLRGNEVTDRSTIDHFDAENTQFILREPREMKSGDAFEIFPAAGANWHIHENTITGCLTPVKLDSYGSETSIFEGNTITRGQVAGVEAAVQVRGWFQLVGNHITGFDEEGSVALALYPDRAGRELPIVCVRNVFERCANVVSETEPGLWARSVATGNIFIDCGRAPEGERTDLDQTAAVIPLVVEPPARSRIVAGPVPAHLTVDGKVDEWPWDDAGRVMTIAQSPEGGRAGGTPALACAARGPRTLYLAIRIPLAEGEVPVARAGGWRGDGVEVSFRDADGGGPIFVHWGSVGGDFVCSDVGGATPAQMTAMQRTIT
ncbi:MAG: right-handed parallel beta-helix repeat-containing protein, partial [Armatimonadetes bacterium]|nr:right-handed parallel beta-helix repeat-containing protein [Armatimonadota bacterium]